MLMKNLKNLEKIYGVLSACNIVPNKDYVKSKEWSETCCIILLFLKNNTKKYINRTVCDLNSCFI